MTLSERVAAAVALAEKCKEGPWSWCVHDSSTATLCSKEDSIGGHIMDVSPCQSCQDSHDEWKFGRCTTPTEAHAELIASAPDLVALCVELHQALKEAEEARTRAELRADMIQEAAVEAADEWREYVIEDNAPRGLVDHIVRAIDVVSPTEPHHE